MQVKVRLILRTEKAMEIRFYDTTEPSFHKEIQSTFDRRPRILPLTKDAVDDGEGHLEHAHEGLRGLQERPVRRHVAESYRGQGDEAEVQRGSEGPVLPGAEAGQDALLEGFGSQAGLDFVMA